MVSTCFNLAERIYICPLFWGEHLMHCCMFDSNRRFLRHLQPLQRFQQVMTHGNAHRIHEELCMAASKRANGFRRPVASIHLQSMLWLIYIMQSLLGSNHISYIHVNPHFTSHIHMSQHGSTSLLVNNPTLTRW